MKDIVSKMIKIEEEISKERGSFELFALFLREEMLDKWDILVAAPWISKDKSYALNFLAKKISRTLTSDEAIKFSRIVVIDHNSKELNAFNNAISIEHGSVDIKDSVFFGLQIKHAYIVTSKKTEHKTTKFLTSQQ